LSEPYGAKGWWPCKQDLNDKIDAIDVFITTPVFNASNEELVAVSNGVEQEQSVDGNFKTTHFKHQYAIPAYLIAIAVTNYEVYSHEVPNNGNPFDIVNYVFPESLAEAQANTPITVDIMNLFTDLFEEYPFANEKYGHAEFGWGGGMEHTTVSFMGNFGRNLIAHELAHQWFGNKVTCGSWKDIWLNESFATYLSGLVFENLDGDAAFTNWKQSRVNSITSSPGGAVYLTDQDTTSVGRIFSGRLSYNKGSMVLHMLRKKLDDANFFQGLKNYLADSDLAYNYAKTEDFIAIMEAASGEDLTEFFNDWLFNEGYPSYSLFWEQTNANALEIQLDQIQSHPSVSFFETGVPIRLIGTLGETLDVVLEHTSSGQVFMQPTTFLVDSIIIDPEVDLISKDNETLPFLSVEAFALDSAVKIYPNPSATFFNIETPSNLSVESVEIYNMLGQSVLKVPFSNMINIESLSSGMHFVKFLTNKGTLHKPLLKN
jgi:aminopeptidase N